MPNDEPERNDAISMPTRSLGSTHIQVSGLGLGLAAACRARYLNVGHDADVARATNRERVFELLETARDLGIRYIDTGRAQGDGERLLADWLEDRGIPPGEFVVASKWGYVRAEELGVEQPGSYLRDHSRLNLDRQWERSESHLGPHLQIYQLRSATFSSAVLENRKVLERLAEIKSEGPHIGLTVRGPRQAELIRRALEIEVEGERLFETIQATWNLLERSAAPALHEARDAGLGVIVKEALANGRLTDRNADARFRNELETLQEEAARLETTVDAVALAAAMDRPWADVVLSGAATRDQLESNVQALRIDLDEEAHRRLSSLERAPEVYWDERELLWEQEETSRR